MALDLATFKTRAISAVVFGIIMLAALLGPKELFFLVFAAITFLCAKEFFTMYCHIKNIYALDTIQLIFAMCCVICYAYIAQWNGYHFFSNIVLDHNIYIGALIILSLLWMAMVKFSKLYMGLLSAYVYIAISFALLAQCYSINRYYPLALIACIWINDTMQYVVGSMVGKTPMAPIISPKKTWEGTIGGSLLCVLAAVIYALVSKQFSITHWVEIALVASIIGTLGDLVESKLKRSAGLKDSGNMMPGHGGAMDRFDSLLLASPFLWVVIKFLD